MAKVSHNEQAEDLAPPLPIPATAGNAPVSPEVPRITMNGDRASSNATRPRHIPDTCACWAEKDRRAARKLLSGGKYVKCQDATAMAGVMAVCIGLLLEGRTVKLDQVLIHYPA